jgi:hypothetical protein
MKLTEVETLTIIPTAPFGFDPTFHKPAHFPSGDNCWEPGEAGAGEKSGEVD